MSIHINQVWKYLDAHPVSSHPGDFQSLLEMIHFIYTDSNPIDNTKIRTTFQQLEVLISNLCEKELDTLLSVVSSLCFEYELLSFSHGIIVGMHLMTELNHLP